MLISNCRYSPTRVLYSICQAIAMVYCRPICPIKVPHIIRQPGSSHYQDAGGITPKATCFELGAGYREKALLDELALRCALEIDKGGKLGHGGGEANADASPLEPIIKAMPRAAFGRDGAPKLQARPASQSMHRRNCRRGRRSSGVCSRYGLPASLVSRASPRSSPSRESVRRSGWLREWDSMRIPAAAISSIIGQSM